MVLVTQYSPVNNQIYTIDGIFSDEEICEFIQHIRLSEEIKHAKPFQTVCNFFNGKEVNPRLSEKMFNKLTPYIPQTYLDSVEKKWTLVNKPDTHIMYAKVLAGQQFAIHTDTGCVYDNELSLYSKFTYLIYLTDNFDGGETVFYDSETWKITCKIVPKIGRILVFDISLFHSGSGIFVKNEKDAKYWIGSELIYLKHRFTDNFFFIYLFIGLGLGLGLYWLAFAYRLFLRQ
jgi:hypothetical protein